MSDRIDSQARSAAMARRNVHVAVLCGAIGVGMVGMAYAAVPLYRLFCQVTGFGGTTQRAVRAPDTVLDRIITVRFDGNVAPGLGWEFQPVVTTMKVRIGEHALAYYKATNRTDRTIVGTSTFNVTPDQVGAFFNKIECFCFTEQRLEPGETVELPVSFFIDPAIVKDLDGAGVRNITLSYTFFPVDHPRSARTDREGTPKTKPPG